MEYNNITVQLLKKIPEIQNLYCEEVGWWDGKEPSPHIVFGDILNPFLIELLAEEKENEILIRIFEFLEEMAETEDEYVLEVLVCTVLERIGDDKKNYMRALKFMGEKCRLLSCDLEKGLGRRGC